MDMVREIGLIAGVGRDLPTANEAAIPLRPMGAMGNYADLIDG